MSDADAHKDVNKLELRADDISEGGSKGFKHNNINIFAVKKNGKVFVYINNCPHVYTELNWEADKFLDGSNSMIQCANHGALFVIESGKCVSGPCNGKKLTAVPFDIIDGVIFPH